MNKVNAERIVAHGEHVLQRVSASFVRETFQYFSIYAQGYACVEIHDTNTTCIVYIFMQIHPLDSRHFRVDRQ